MFSTLLISNILMKTYLKRPYEQPSTAIYYSSSDVLSHFSSRSSNFQQRVVQPSAKEQERLLSSSNAPRFQHVHLGKYGIKPLQPSDNLLYEQQQVNRRPSKVIRIHVTLYTFVNRVFI